LNLGIHSLDDNERVKYGSSLDDMCSEDGCGGLGLGIVRYPYYFVENGFIYTVYYGGDISPFRDRSELSKFKESITDLFNSFKTK
jgi:hypothetical protein